MRKQGGFQSRYLYSISTMKTLDDLINNTRTFRRFHQDVVISVDILKELVNLARLGGSARNLQPLKYMLVNDAALNAKVFPHLFWAGYLPDWPGPEEGERPTAYIICLRDNRLCQQGADCDLGIATQNILLGATARGLGGCRIASISPKLCGLLNIPEHLRILMVIALGKPKETVCIEEANSPDGNIKYWRDNEQIHHVPKRSLNEIIIKGGK